MSPPPKLILHPKDPEVVPQDLQLLLQGLHETGLLGEPFEYQQQPHFEAGGHFLELITFLGCSPVIGLEPSEDDDKFCHLHVRGPKEQVEFMYSNGDVSPRCPKCRYAVHDWPDLIQQWQQDPLCRLWDCPECGAETDLYRMNWRQAAGFGRLFIEVWGIFPHEAVPTEPLLNTLARLTDGQDWSFFYA